MATDSPDTGAGATVALTTATFTASIINVSELREVVERLDITHLGVASADEALKYPGDNPDLQDITVTYQFKSEESPPRARANVSDTITITLPAANTSNTTPFSVVCSGFVAENTLLPALARNQINQGTLVFTPNGTTVTITAET